MDGTTGLKKVIILTYFFPPGNFAGSYRLFSWARYLYKFGFYPIIITRHWEKDQTDYAGISQKKELEIQKHEHYEVHYLPYNGNLRDKIKAKYGNKFWYVTKFLSLVELICQNFLLYVIPSRNLYYYTKKLIANDPEIRYLFASGKPYILFRFGYLLKKEFPYIRWIADYRDPWNTHWWLIKKMPFILKKIETHSEKKWLSNAEAFTTCSQEWKVEIETFTQKKGFVVFNGYEEDDKAFFENTLSNHTVFSILHNGSIYGLFNIEIFIESIKQLINKGNYSIKIHFPGVLIDEKEGKRIQNAIIGYEDYFELTGRVSHYDLMNLMKDANLLLVFGTKEMGGWVPLKIFEYFIASKPILHCPGDDEIITKMITETRTGYVTYTVEETVTVLDELYSNWSEKKTLPFEPNFDAIAEYSRHSQANKLANSISQVDFRFAVPLIPVSKFRQNIFETAYNFKFHNILRLTNTKSDTLVLCFHDISDVPNPSYPSLPTKQFERIIEYLSYSYEFTTLENIYNKKKTDKTKVLLTFDDGYKSFKTIVVPLLKKYNTSAICSVIVDTIDSGRRFWTDRLNASLNHIYSNYPQYNYHYEDIDFEYNYRTDIPDRCSNAIFRLLLEKPSDFRTNFVNGIEQKLGLSFEWSSNFMNWDDIADCVNEGMTIASHSRTHNILNTIIKDEELQNEIELSKRVIEQKTKQKVTVFTCPNGIYNEKVISMVEAADYKYMFTTEEHKTKQSSISNQKLNMLPRISVNKSSFEENIFKINNFFSMARPLSK